MDTPNIGRYEASKTSNVGYTASSVNGALDHSGPPVINLIASITM